MKKRPDEDYRGYAIRWKNAASMVRPPFTNREENFMFMDTLPSSYYDMLIIYTFIKFKNLMYFVGRIEDGIKRGRIVDIGASMMEKKRIIPNKHVQAMSRDKKRSHTTWEKLIKSHPSSPGYAQVPFFDLHSPQRFAQEYD